MEYTNLQKRMLQDLGRTESGTQLLAILETAKAHYSSIKTIDKNRPAEVQIEGRELFCQFVDDLSAQIKKQPHQTKRLESDDYT